MGRYEKAVETYEQTLQGYPDHATSFHSHAALAILYAEGDRMDEAKAEAAKLMKLVPNFSVQVWGERNPMKD